MSHPHGLAWQSVLGGYKPIWTEEPNLDIIETICRQNLHLPLHHLCRVTFHAKGLVNKLYLVDIGSDEYIFRVSLPVNLHEKVASEVATTRFLDDIVGVPVPNIIAYDPSNSNNLHFSWILMSLIRGSTLGFKWRKMAWERKITLVRRLAYIQAQIYKHRFRSIGSLYSSHPPHHHDGDHSGISSYCIMICLGIVILMLLSPRLLLAFITIIFYNKHRDYDACLGRLATVDLIHSPSDTSRGPYPTIHSRLEARIFRARQREYGNMRNFDSEDTDLIHAHTRLLKWLPHFFPPAPSITRLLLHDLHAQKILVDENDSLLALVDFEMISTVPSSLYCDFPSFLHTDIRRKPPQRIDYADDDERVLHERYIPLVENEGKNPLYWQHLGEYEMTRLREVYQEEMGRTEAEWGCWYERGRSQRMFLKQLVSSDYGFYTGPMAWLDKYEKGEDWEDFDCWEETSYDGSSCWCVSWKKH